MQKLYYLFDDKGKYRNFVILCNQECVLSSSVHKEHAIIYTASQMDMAKRYFKRNGIDTFPEEVTPKIRTYVRKSDSLPVRGRPRKRISEGSDISNRKAETNRDGMGDVGGRTDEKESC